MFFLLSGKYDLIHYGRNTTDTQKVANLSTKYDPLEVKNTKETQNKQSYVKSLHFSDAPVPIKIEKIFTTSTGGIIKYFWNTPMSFMVDNNQFILAFCNRGKLYKINIKNFENILLDSIDLKLSDDRMYGNLVMNDKYIVLTMANREILIFDHQLKTIKTLEHKCGIISKPIILDNKLYFIDLSDAINEITLDGQRRSFIPENLGMRFDISAENFLITNEHVIYGSTTSCVYIIQKSNFSLLKTIKMDSVLTYLKNTPILYKNNYIVTSDTESIQINKETLEVDWKISKGSFAQHVIYDNHLILGDENFINIFSLLNQQNKQPKFINQIFLGPNSFVMHIFTYRDDVFVIDSSGNIYLIDLFRNKFFSCRGNVETKHTPIIKIIQNRCFILIMNLFGELELHELKNFKQPNQNYKKTIQKRDFIPRGQI